MRLESIHQEVISFERFAWRCLRYALIALLVLLVGLLPGVIGFMLLAELAASQAWLNALSMVSGLELPYPVADFHTLRPYTSFWLFIAYLLRRCFLSPSLRYLHPLFTACFTACTVPKRRSKKPLAGLYRVSKIRLRQ